MARKRGFGDESSSDDDFQPPDDAAFSRLKRVRRASARERVGRRGGAQESEGDGEVISIPDSIEDEGQGQEDTGVEETPLSEGEGADGRDGRAQEIDGNDAGGEDEEDTGDGGAHGIDGNDAGDEDDANNDNRGDESDGTVQKDDVVTKKRTRRVPTANASSFASSDSESEASDEDGDVYNSEDDEPNDSDVESDFAPSPKKSKPAPKSSAKAKKPSPKTVRKPLANANTSLNVRKPKRSPAVAPTAGKKRLGARIPSKLSALGKTPGGGAQKARPAATAKTGALMYRAGLSRNAAIPPLHSYLRKSQ